MGGLGKEGEEWDRFGRRVLLKRDFVDQELTLGSSVLWLDVGVDWGAFAAAKTSNWRAT